MTRRLRRHRPQGGCRSPGNRPLLLTIFQKAENGQGDMAGDQGGMSSGQPGHRVDMQGPAFVTSDHVYRAGQWLGAVHLFECVPGWEPHGATRLTDQQALDFLGPVPPGTPGVNAYMMVPTHGTIETHRPVADARYHGRPQRLRRADVDGGLHAHAGARRSHGNVEQ